MNTSSLSLVRASIKYAYVADNVPLSVTGDLTIEAWIKFNSIPAGELTICGKYRLLGATQESYLFLYNGTSGSLNAFISSTGGSGTQAARVWSPSTGVWYHVSMVYTAASGKIQFFVNGVQLGADITGMPTSIFDSNARFSVGAYSSDDGSPAGLFDGLIEEVRVYNAARTAAQILGDYQMEVGTSANLVGYWKFNNDLTDASGNASTLTGVNSPTFSTDVPVWPNLGVFMGNL